MGWVSRIVIVVFGLCMGAFSIALYEIGLNLGWVYLFMGVVIGSAVAPLWFLLNWKGASGKGAVVAAWGGFILALLSWIAAALIQSGTISVDALGTNEVMLSGNLVAIFSSAIIHYLYSKFVDPTDYDFSELDKNIKLVEQDLSGLGAEQQDPVELDKAFKWITRRGYLLTLVLIVVWPVLSIPAGKFTQDYFAFWVLIAILWGFGAAVVITVLPITESSDQIGAVFAGMTGKSTEEPEPEPVAEKIVPVAVEKPVEDVEPEPVYAGFVPDEDDEEVAC